MNQKLKQFILTMIDIAITILSFLSTIYLTDPSHSMKSVFPLAFYYLPIEAAAVCVMMMVLGLYKSLNKYVGISELIKLMIIVGGVSVLNLIFVLIIERNPIGFSYVIVNGAIMFLLLSGFRFAIRIAYSIKNNEPLSQRGENTTNVMIIGAGDAGALVIREMINSARVENKPVCIIDDDPTKLHSTICSVPVVGDRTKIIEMVGKYNVKQIVVALPSSEPKNRKEIINICKESKCKVMTVPGMYELVNGTVKASKLRNVEIRDLLGRGEIKVNLNEIMQYIEGKTVLVTGGGGSIGSELSRQIARHNPKQLIILDIYENNAYDIEQELKRTCPYLNLLTLIASIRDKGKLEDIFKKYPIDIIFNAAAHKHVPLMETSPNEAIKNNVFGCLNLARLADQYGVKKFVQISTDKAVNPTNIMGASKRICEMIIQTVGRNSKTCDFVAVRFGNVLGSNGSVIPLFKKQIAEGGPVTVTHKDIIRYFMTIPEAVSLVLQAGAYAKGGEIFVLDMGEPVRIYDLAENLIKLSGYTPNVDIQIQVTGLRPGEKLYEERLMAEEGLRKTDNGLINIANPIPVDEEQFFSRLDKLYTEAYNETEHMKELVKELVPTYVIK